MQIEAVLTTEQRQELRVYRDLWRAARRSIAPADRDAAEAGVRLAYESAGLKPPGSIRWCPGPIAMARDWCEAIGRESIGANVKPLIYDSVQSRAAAEADGKLNGSVRFALFEVGLAARDGVSIAVSEAVSVEASKVRPRWRARLRGALAGIFTSASSTRLVFNSCAFGQHDVGWLGLYAFLHDIYGMARQTEKLRGLWAIAQNAGWIVPHEDVCWLSERQSVLRVDAADRLHCADGPAVEFPDGFRAHFWKGVQVSAWVIEQPDRITAVTINCEANRHVRRCMIDIMTPERFVATSGAVPVSSDETGTLWQKQWFRDTWAAVEVVNGTPETDGSYKHYYLGVPPDLRTAREAVAWTYGLTADQYQRLRVRT